MPLSNGCWNHNIRNRDDLIVILELILILISIFRHTSNDVGCLLPKCWMTENLWKAVSSTGSTAFTAWRKLSMRPSLKLQELVPLIKMASTKLTKASRRRRTRKSRCECYIPPFITLQYRLNEITYSWRCSVLVVSFHYIIILLNKDI